MFSMFVSDNDGIVRYNGKKVNGNQVCNIIGVDTYDMFTRIVAKLCRKGVLGRVRIPDEIFRFHELKHFCANPFIYEVENPKKEIVEHFKKFKWDDM